MRESKPILTLERNLWLTPCKIGMLRTSKHSGYEDPWKCFFKWDPWVCTWEILAFATIINMEKNVTNWDTKYVAFNISEKQFAQELRGLFFHAKLMQFSVKMPKWMNPTFLLAALYISEL